MSSVRLSPTVATSVHFVEACRQGDLKTLQTMHGTQQNMFVLHSSFFTACKNGQVAVVKALLEQYTHKMAELMTREKYEEVVYNGLASQCIVGCTVLMVASLHGHVAVIDALVRYGAEVNHGNTRGETALMMASLKGHLPAVNSLVNHGADVNTRNSIGHTSLMLASMKGHVHVIDALVDHGADINLCDKDGKTALAWASEEGHVTVINALVDYDANVNRRDEYGKTALVVASQKGHVHAISVLLNHGADVNSRDETGKTALVLASQRGHVSVIHSLVKHGASVNTHDEINMTALMWASWGGHIAVVNALLTGGADVNGCNETGRTALMWASEGGHVTVIDALVTHGADVNICDGDSQTALMLASEKGHVHVVDALVNHGADINARDKLGKTALLLATMKGHVGVVEALVNHETGVDNNIRDKTDKLSHKASSARVDPGGSAGHQVGTIERQPALDVVTLRKHLEVALGITHNLARPNCDDNTGTISMCTPVHERDLPQLQVQDTSPTQAVCNDLQQTNKDLTSHGPNNTVQEQGRDISDDHDKTPSDSQNCLNLRHKCDNKTINSVLRAFIKGKQKSRAPMNMTLNLYAKKAKYFTQTGNINVETAENVAPTGNTCINVENAEYVAQKGNVNVTTSQCIPGCERPELSDSESETDDQPDLEGVLDELTDTF